MRVVLHTPGAPEHGVARHAATLARQLTARGVTVVDHGADVAHTQFTDALWGPDVAAAAAAFTRWTANSPRPLVVTLHDVPGGDADPDRDRRRVLGYAEVAAAADAVVVSAHHEAARLAATTGHRASVVPLPVEALPMGQTPPWADRVTLGVLGFVYPGKGHAAVIAAAARQPSRPLVVVAGAVSPRHGGLWSELVRQAAAAGVELLLTGALDDGAMGAAARAVTVPVVPSRTVSASGTLATWWGCDRRPLVARSPYAVEQARDRPECLWLYEPDGLDAAIGAVLADPGRSRIDAPPRWPDVGAEHVAVYRRLLAERGRC
jgi:glycosyltransferase involved in cell wall biosynthesis